MSAEPNKKPFEITRQKIRDLRQTISEKELELKEAETVRDSLVSQLSHQLKAAEKKSNLAERLGTALKEERTKDYPTLKDELQALPELARLVVIFDVIGVNSANVSINYPECKSSYYDPTYGGPSYHDKAQTLSLQEPGRLADAIRNFIDNIKNPDAFRKNLFERKKGNGYSRVSGGTVFNFESVYGREFYTTTVTYINPSTQTPTLCIGDAKTRGEVVTALNKRNHILTRGGEESYVSQLILSNGADKESLLVPEIPEICQTTQRIFDLSATLKVAKSTLEELNKTLKTQIKSERKDREGNEAARDFLRA